MGNNIKIDKKNINKALKTLKLSNLVLEFEECDDVRGYSIKNVDGKAVISYNEPCDLFRAFLYISQNGVKNITQTRKFEKLGYMIDVARDAVPKIETLKKLVDYLAILGYNRLYVYLEDLFEIKEEPFFGYMRGRYTEEELKELDNYCADFGMELVPCIQTLAHLNGIFRWPEYKKCNDVADILLVGDQRTHRLISNMFDTISKVFRSKTLHIGMDEAHLVGRGKYLDKNGYQNGYDVMEKHIKKVCELAKPYGFELMIWSDMYFRLATGGAYYSNDGVFTKEVCDQIPDNITLVYWDYYNRDKDLVSHMMEEHINTRRKMAFAGGAWKWNGWNPDTKMSMLASKVVLEACKNYNVKDVMLTAWADDGAEASLFSALPVIVYYAEHCYNEAVEENQVDEVLKSVWGLALSDFYTADMLLVSKDEFEENYLFWKLPKMLLYNDPLIGVHDWIVEKYNVENNLNEYAKKLNCVKRNVPVEFKYIFENIENFCKVLQLKATLGLDMRRAYQENNIQELEQIAYKRIPSLIGRIKIFEKGFYKQWTLENKDNGYHTHDNRLWGLIKRLQSARMLIIDYISGKQKEIYQLKDKLLTIEGEDALNVIMW